MEQKYTSAGTSISVVNKVYKQYNFRPNSVVFDYGGGKYDKNKTYMRETYNSDVLIYDPYNRSVEHNKAVSLAVNKIAHTGGLDYIVCSNVLNVIAEDAVLYKILNDIRQLACEKTEVLITIYEGDGTGVGKQTTKGYQRNQKTKNYIQLCKQFFSNVELKKGIIICRIV